jgi:hypothetical protein
MAKTKEPLKFEHRDRPTANPCNVTLRIFVLLLAFAVFWTCFAVFVAPYEVVEKNYKHDDMGTYTSPIWETVSVSDCPP